jgi:hypothetical protein
MPREEAKQLVCHHCRDFSHDQEHGEQRLACTLLLSSAILNDHGPSFTVCTATGAAYREITDS